MRPLRHESAGAIRYLAIFGGGLLMAACLIWLTRASSVSESANLSPDYFLSQMLDRQSCDRADGSASKAQSGCSTQASLLVTAIGGAIAPSLWPEIHEYARQAKVPVMMYHDILPEKEVFFDVTPQELEAHFERIQAEGMTPIHMDWLVAHLQSGRPLPEKPILLTFDDGYSGHYHYVYPLLKQYGYPAVFSIYTEKVERQTGRSSVTWEQLQRMAADPLVTIASHSVTHPRDLTQLTDEELVKEIVESKQRLEEKLEVPIHYFTYPEGHSDERVEQLVAATGYRAALSMDDWNEHFAGESEDLLTIGRFGQSRLEDVIPQAWGGNPLPRTDGGFDFTTSVQKQDHNINGISVTLITGGRPLTIHADSRYQVMDIIKGTEAIAAVDGGFFSLKYLDSNVMIGPVLSQSSGEFIPGYSGEISKLRGRPLILIGPQVVKFVPFDPDNHNTLDGIMAELGAVTDAFVGAAWLVKDGLPQPADTFGSLFDYDAARHRAFWGINWAGQPVVGATNDLVDSVALGEILHQLGLRDAVMLDSGASTSVAFKGESLAGYTPRPVPHVVALFPPLSPQASELQADWDQFGVWLDGEEAALIELPQAEL